MADDTVFYKDQTKYLSGGAYKQPGIGGDQLVTQLIGMLSPHLAQLAQSLDLDATAIRTLTNTMNTQGSLFTPTNYANVMFNAQAATANRQMMQPFEAGIEGTETQVMTGIYSKMFPGNEVEINRRVTAAQANIFNPMNVITEHLAGGYQMDEMRRGLLNTSLFSGIYNTSRMADPFQPSIAEIQAAGGTSYMNILDEQNRRREAFKPFAAQIREDYVNNISLYGGLSGGEVGTLTADMARRGALRDEQGDLFTPAGAGGDQTARLSAASKRVQAMSRAMAPLKEFFNESMPQLLERLDSTFGVNAAATFSPEQIQSKVLQMKHTARMTGTSMEQLMGMAQGAQTYYRSLGMDTPMGGGTAAMVAAGMLGAGGVDRSRLNLPDFERLTFRNVVGAQTSDTARALSGAFVLANAGGMLTGETRRERIAKFRNIVNAGGGPRDLEAALGGRFRMQDILEASGTLEAEDVRTQTDLFTMAMSQTFTDYNQDIRSEAREIFNERLGLSLTADDMKKFSVRGMGAFLEKQGIANTPENRMKMAAARGAVRDFADITATGYGYESANKIETAEQSLEVSRKMGLLRDVRARYEADITNRGVGTVYGMTGLLSFITGEGQATARQKIIDDETLSEHEKARRLEELERDRATVGNLATSMLGITDFKALRGNISKIAGKDATRSVSDVTTQMEGLMNVALAGTTETGKTISEDNMTIFRSLLEGDMKEEDAVAAMSKLTSMWTKTGREEQIIEQGFGAKEAIAFRSITDKPERSRKLKEGAMRIALADMKIEDEKVNISEQLEKGISLEGISKQLFAGDEASQQEFEKKTREAGVEGMFKIKDPKEVLLERIEVNTRK